MPYIVLPASFIRGMGWPAVECEASDPEAVCPASYSDRIWLKPVDTLLFNSWKTAGEPIDVESLAYFGAVHVRPQ